MRGISLVVCGVAASGCYVGVHSTNSVLKTDPVEASGMPASSVSVSAHTLDFVAGARYRKFELFAGYGVGSARANSQTSTVAETSENDSSRASLGGSVSLFQFNYFMNIGLFGIISGSDFILSSDVNEQNSVENSYEAGIQLKALMPPGQMSGFNAEPFLRLGIASQTGRVKPGLYVNDEGNSEFTATAIMATIGFNVGYGFGQR